MVDYHKLTLKNGLIVLLHQDYATPMVAVNVLYKVGSKNESPSKTGFTHLFEHLMFGGTPNVANFDKAMQKAGGENNAFTNSDITNFYDLMPYQNLKSALWLEADRMRGINLNKKSLNTQKKVVVEEFKETCLNEPYGDMWHHISEMLYPDHPYNWPTIGKEISHIESSSLEDVQKFFNEYYRPDNAILAICGRFDMDDLKEQVEEWFSNITCDISAIPSLHNVPNVPVEQTKVIHSNVPSPCIILGFKMKDRLHPDYYVADLISDILSSGRSSRFYQNLIKEKEIFSNLDAYISGVTDEGAFIVEGKLMDDVLIEDAQEAIWEELDNLKNQCLDELELRKIKNKAESSLIFSETNVLSKAMSLAYYEYLGDVDLINTEYLKYEDITTEDIQRVANDVFDKTKVATLIYIPNEQAKV
jgi:predicted Zn-dependent peptidase